MKKSFYSVVIFLSFAFCLCLMAGCESEKTIKYHTYVYAYNVEDPSAQGCVVVCGDATDDAIWVDLPISYDNVSAVLEEDSLYFWDIKTDEMLYNSESPHVFIKTGTNDNGYILYENNTDFMIGLKESADYVLVDIPGSRVPIEVPLRRKIVEYEY